MKKEAYLDSIAGAGFQDVDVVNETAISLDLWSSDPAAEAIFEDAEASPEELQETEAAIASIKVYGVKPTA